MERSDAESHVAKGDETILLVEENEIERKLALSALQRYRYRVLEAASSVEALMLTQQYNGIVHLTVSPLAMPEIGGRELARRLLRLHPTMKHCLSQLTMMKRFNIIGLTSSLSCSNPTVSQD
jgi:CheY-like chemotaxis protein